MFFSVDGAQPRYGIPFLGDNNFMVDRLQEEREEQAQPTAWIYPVDLRAVAALSTASLEEIPPLHRMPVWIHRENASQTVSALFAVTRQLTVAVPNEAWVTVGPQQTAALAG